MLTITQVIHAETNLTIFKRGVTETGLEELLNGPEKFTVFAPSDLAFGKLESSMLGRLLRPENNFRLTDLMNRHIVAGSISLAELKDGDKLKTLNGQEFTVQVKDGKTLVNGATIQNHDIKTTNGVIHSLDRIMKMDTVPIRAGASLPE
jgi:uncharacterized surface protein with fasciclin (FAS1) repeats